MGFGDDVEVNAIFINSAGFSSFVIFLTLLETTIVAYPEPIL